MRQTKDYLLLYGKPERSTGISYESDVAIRLLEGLFMLIWKENIIFFRKNISSVDLGGCLKALVLLHLEQYDEIVHLLSERVFEWLFVM